jgi:hypothetical protein
MRFFRSGIFVWAIVCTLFFWKLTLTNQFVIFDDPDMAHQVIPWWTFEASQVHHSVIPLWDPHHWLGQPLLGQGQPMVALPTNYLFLLGPRKGGQLSETWLKLYFAFLHFLAGLTLYWLARDQKLSKTASIGGALVFATAGIFGQLSWPMMLNGAIVGPLVLLFALRVLRGERQIWHAACAGAALGYGWLSGHHQIPIFLTLMLAGLLIYAWTQKKDWRFIWVLAAAFGIMFLIGAAQTLPALEYGKEAERWVGAKQTATWETEVPYSVHQRGGFAIPAVNILNIVLTKFIDAPSIWVGITALLLAIFGAANRWKQSLSVAPTVCIALGALVYTLAGSFAFQGPIYALIPMVDKARTPAMASAVFTMSIALLAAFGLDAIRRHRSDSAGDFQSSASLPKWLTVLGLLCIAPFVGMILERKDVSPQEWTFIGFFILIGGGILFAMQKQAIKGSTAAVALVILLYADLSSGLNYSWSHREEQQHGFLDKIASQRDLVTFLRGKQNAGETFRVDIDETLVSYNFGDLYGFDQVRGYLASLTLNLRLVPLRNLRGLRYVNTRYWIGKERRGNFVNDVFTSSSGLKIFEDPGAMPRAFAVQRLHWKGNVNEMPWFMEQSPEDLRVTAASTAKIEGLPDCPGNPEGKFHRPHANKVTVDITLPCKKLVVVSELYDANWTATIDGNPTPIYPVNGAFRGVVVDAGQHRIEMRYRPKMAYLGLALTLSGVILMFTLRRHRWTQK